jgi:hypothetical protein
MSAAANDVAGKSKPNVSVDESPDPPPPPLVPVVLLDEPPQAATPNIRTATTAAAKVLRKRNIIDPL